MRTKSCYLLEKKEFVFIFFLFIVMYDVSGQIDNSGKKETNAFKYQPEEKSKNKNITFSKFESLKKEGDNNTPFGTLNDISKNFSNYSVIPDNNKKRKFDDPNTEKDVLVKKYWMGKDVSVKKLKTKLELGKLETTTKKIRIECRDHSYVDGDRVRLYVNEKVVRSNIILYSGYYSIDIELKEGHNRIDIEALNQGTSGPNTAEFRVFDGNGNLLTSNEWNILTGYIATLVITKY